MLFLMRSRRQMVNQFREALDKQGATLTPQSAGLPSHPSHPSSSHHGAVKNGPNGGPVKRSVSGRFEEISVRTSARQFETFVKGIAKCNNLLDARRLRSDVAGQIRKARLAVEGREPEEVVQGVRVAVWEEHVERLLMAKRKADQRIADLGGAEGSSVSVNRTSSMICDAPLWVETLTRSMWHAAAVRRRRNTPPGSSARHAA